MPNFDKILEDVSAGKINSKELKLVADELKKDDSNKDKYTLLLILGRSMHIEYKDLVESFLEDYNDPMITRLSLQILCKFWGLTDSYLDYIKNFLKKNDWDEDDDVRDMAISIVGEYLSKKDNNVLLKIIFDTYQDAEEDELIRSFAYIAMARATGVEWSELPQLSRLPSLDELVDDSIIDSICNRLS